MANQNNQTTNQKNNRTQISEPDLRLTIQRTAKQTVKGARVQQKQPQKRFAKDTVVKTHSVATDSKTCSKRISSHPSVRHAIYIVAKKTKKICTLSPNPSHKYNHTCSALHRRSHRVQQEIQNKLHSPTEWVSWIPPTPKKGHPIHVRRLCCSRPNLSHRVPLSRQ